MKKILETCNIDIDSLINCNVKSKIYLFNNEDDYEEEYISCCLFLNEDNKYYLSVENTPFEVCETFIVNDYLSVFHFLNSYNYNDSLSEEDFQEKSNELFDNINNFLISDCELDYRLFPQQIDLADIISYSIKSNISVNEARKLLKTHIPNIKDNLRANNSNVRTNGYVGSFCKAIGIKKHSLDFIQIIDKLLEYKNIITYENLKTFNYSSVSRRKKDVERFSNCLDLFSNLIQDLKKCEKLNTKNTFNSKSLLDYSVDSKSFCSLVETCHENKDYSPLKSLGFSDYDIKEMTKNKSRIKAFSKEVFFGKFLSSLQLKVKGAKNTDLGGVDFSVELDNKIAYVSYKSLNNYIVKNGGSTILGLNGPLDICQDIYSLNNYWSDLISLEDKDLTKDVFTPYLNNIRFGINNLNTEDFSSFVQYFTNLYSQRNTHIFIGDENNVISKYINSMSYNQFMELYSYKDYKCTIKSRSVTSVTFEIKIILKNKNTNEYINTNFSFKMRDKSKRVFNSKLCTETPISGIKKFLSLFDLHSENIDLNDFVNGKTTFTSIPSLLCA